MKPTPTWILISDGAKATIYDYHGPKHKLTVVDDAEFKHVNKPTRELTSTERGRSLQSYGSARPALDQRTDPHEHEKQKFAHELANFLDVKNNRYDRLIVAAPPKMLGYLREKLSKQQLRKTVAEIDKDLTNATEVEIEKHLQNIIHIDVNRSMWA